MNGRVLLAAHGTRDPAGAQVVAALARAVRDRLPEATVEVCWLSTGRPTLEQSLATDPTVGSGATDSVGPGVPVVVPLLLGSGYHVQVDIPRIVAAAAAGSGEPPARVTTHLGPHRHLVRALLTRILEVDPTPVAVLLAAAGSSHPVSRSETRQVADMLSAALDVPVSVAYASGGGPDVASAVALFRQAGVARVTVAPYLLSPGYFADRIRADAEQAGTACAAVLADHPAIVDLIVERVRAVGRPARPVEPAGTAA